MDSGIQPWLFQPEPYESESLSHFLGRFRRQNHLTPSGLGKLAGIGAVVARWERFHLNPPPSRTELEALAEVVGVSAGQLATMLPPKGVGMQGFPIRLCGACYGETPCHQIQWQYKSVWKCDRHQLLLLPRCPKCKGDFKVPAEWVSGSCSRCSTLFGEMKQFQKST